jgi:hypothetical protein
MVWCSSLVGVSTAATIVFLPDLPCQLPLYYCPFADHIGRTLDLRSICG